MQLLDASDLVEIVFEEYIIYLKMVFHYKSYVVSMMSMMHHGSMGDRPTYHSFIYCIEEISYLKLINMLVY